MKILVLDPTGLNPATWWRLYEPFNRIAKDYRGKVSVTYSDGRDLLTQDLGLFDVLIYYITLNEGITGIVEEAKKQGVKVVLDCDDNVFNLHPSFPAWQEYQNRQNLLTINFQLADEIWFSTDYLNTSYSKIGPHRYTVPNGVLPETLPEQPNTGKRHVLWRGTEAHIVNLFDPAQGWYHVAASWADRWTWFGYVPPFAHRDKKNNFLGKVPAPDFLPALRRAAPTYIWKPLNDCPQYHAITPIAWIEATQVGAACVTNFAGLPGWENCFASFQDAEDGHAGMWEASCNRIRADFNLNKINQFRVSRLSELTGLIL